MNKDNYFTLAVGSTTSSDSNLRLGIYSVRRKVYVDEIGLDPKLLTDELDKEALHIACIRLTPKNYNTRSMSPQLDGIEIDDVVGTARVTPTKYTGVLQVERVSVIKDARKQGLAQNMVVELEKQACLNYDKLGAFYLSGDEKAEKLYKRAGYLTIPNSLHIRSNIKHIKMIKPMNDYWKVEDNWLQLL
ncbi:hypothetical protein CONCODRAFT_9967 [Conidiobolus coronatus NRRL 28638]|uniref:N-acetyltransferase domain-containing protein n=1 Tax=Conidiobolus coronatus (strain ATCC 28846 / CBS 209.66 / NRRL 28638) TaxID=796925 RepID=A0A137NZ21_CONC2|nr:hypothetical protein CONCODRAFT_9967 [Conidiobolus coronatus NRRL 28638]|eukprot:KXN67901.1 hypothetical protein CONCODRAFT_9967 [Conidiobolus coronatus NRRL 28638]